MASLRVIALMLIGSLALSSCQPTYDDQVERLGSLLHDNRIGSGQDYWLVKLNTGVEDRVALIFGFLNDGAFCSEVAELYMRRFPADTYTCKPAN